MDIVLYCYVVSLFVYNNADFEQVEQTTADASEPNDETIPAEPVQEPSLDAAEEPSISEVCPRLISFSVDLWTCESNLQQVPKEETDEADPAEPEIVIEQTSSVEPAMIVEDAVQEKEIQSEEVTTPSAEEQLPPSVRIPRLIQ